MLRKICHAKVGSIVEITDGDGKLRTCRVCVVPDKHKRAARVGMTHGLYDEQRMLFLVDTLTWEFVPMPHLSSKAEIHDAHPTHTGWSAHEVN